MIYTALHRKLLIKKYYKPGVNSGAPEGFAVPAPLVVTNAVSMSDVTELRLKTK